MKNILFTLCLLFSFGALAQQATDNGPRLVFGELKHEGPYDRSEILLQDRLNTSSGDGNKYEVVKYKMIIAPKGGNASLYSGSGDKLTPKMQGALNQIVAGDKVVIESVLASINGDVEDLIELKPIVLIVKGFEPSDDPYYNPTSKTKMDSSLLAKLGDLDFSKAHSVEDVLKSTEISVYSSRGLDYKVIGFKLITAPKDGSASMASSSSNQLTTGMTTMIAKLKSGDRIIIESIRAKSEEKGEFVRAKLSPIVITIL